MQPDNQNKLLIFSFALAITILLLLCSCSVQKDKEKVKTETETQTTTQSENNAFKTSFSIEPVDNLRPFTYAGKTYENTKIIYLTDKSKEVKKVEEKKVETVKVKAMQKVEKADSTIFLYGFLIIGVVLCFGLWLLNKNFRIT